MNTPSKPILVPTPDQQAILNQIQTLYQQLCDTSDKHYTLQQWFGLKSIDEE